MIPPLQRSASLQAVTTTGQTQDPGEGKADLPPQRHYPPQVLAASDTEVDKSRHHGSGFRSPQAHESANFTSSSYTRQEVGIARPVDRRRVLRGLRAALTSHRKRDRPEPPPAPLGSARESSNEASGSLAAERLAKKNSGQPCRRGRERSTQPSGRRHLPARHGRPSWAAVASASNPPTPAHAMPSAGGGVAMGLGVSRGCGVLKREGRP